MAAPTIFIVDDNAAVRDSIAELVDSVGLRHACYESALAFLADFDPAAPGCLVLDVRMAHMSGPALQERLNAMGARIPIVFVSGHAEVDVVVRTIKAGAVNFVAKPYRDQQLLDSINEALSRDAAERARHDPRPDAAARVATLSPREREVMTLVVAGQSSKEIARALRISHRTVELHRSHVFEKLGVRSAVELVRFAVDAGLA